MNTYWTSDTHWAHANIINLAKRPFKDVHEMDNVLIHNWNSVVQPGDTVYHLGDFNLGGRDTEDFLKRLNGTIHLLVGNHEKRALMVRDRFASVSEVIHATINCQKMTMCHYAWLTWPDSGRGSWMLHGHSHGGLPDDPTALRLDVGVDCWNYTPVSFHQLRARMATKTYKPIDHHGRTGADV